jgi:cytochrome b pre-mRNA-processing protein 3
MVLSLFRKSSATGPVFDIYAALVAQSRQPRFYAEWGVPDTVTGRFDMISLHLALLFRRLRAEKGDAKAFSQRLFDLFFLDMDRSLREMGAGDLAVPKKIRNMGNMFYGLLASLDTALSADSAEAVEAVLARNVYAATPGQSARPLADYLIAESQRLAGIPAQRILAGALDQGVAA